MPAQTGALPFVTVCGPLALSDLLPGFILLIVLLWPEIAEVSFGGFGLKRRLDEQTERLNGLRDELVRVTTNVGQSQQTVFLTGPVAWDEVQAMLGRKAQDFPSAENVEGSANREPAHAAEAAQRGILMAELFNIWETLNSYIKEVVRTRHPSTAARFVSAYRPEQLEVISAWATDFAPELRLVQATRNTLAHTPNDVSTSDLEEALQTAEQLLSLLESHLYPSPGGTEI